MDTIHTLIQIGCQQDLLFHQMDVKSAPIAEEIYKQLQGNSSTQQKSESYANRFMV